MRDSTKEFVKICSDTLPFSEPIYEFDCQRQPEREHYSHFEYLFPEKKYVTAHLGPDNENILSESVKSALVIDSLEHAEYKRKVIDELYRVLAPDGMLIISSYMEFPIHDEPNDYWRFTPEAFKSLLKPFNSSYVDFAGKGYFPHSVIGIGFKGDVPANTLDDFKKELEGWKKYWSHPRRYKKGFLVKLFG